MVTWLSPRDETLPPGPPTERAHRGLGMSIEWMVALAVFAGVALLWYSQRADAPYRRDRRKASGGGAGSQLQADETDGV